MITIITGMTMIMIMIMITTTIMRHTRMLTTLTDRSALARGASDERIFRKILVWANSSAKNLRPDATL